MKKLSFLVVLVMISLSALAQTTVKLPSPDKQVAMTLYEALQTRHSVRSYQNKDRQCHAGSGVMGGVWLQPRSGEEDNRRFGAQSSGH
mgnify:CR=1 FL=1